MGEYWIFIRKLLLFGIILLVVDLSAGYIMDKLLVRAPYGNFGRLNYIINQCNDDILVFGSSRAVHHYDPVMIQDSLKMSCYNCGFDGNGILLMNGLYQMMSKRHTPKIIIYEVSSRFDSGIDDNTKYLGWLRPFYKNNSIAELFDEIDPIEKYKLISNLYRWNVKFLQLSTDNIKDFKKTISGYKPHEGIMDDLSRYQGLKSLKETKNSLVEPPSDSVKIKRLVELINTCKAKGTKLFFYVSPSYCTTPVSQNNIVRKIAKENQVPFVDHGIEPSIYTDYTLFKDRTHLNKQGAEMYTSIVISEINEFLEGGELKTYTEPL